MTEENINEIPEPKGDLRTTIKVVNRRRQWIAQKIHDLEFERDNVGKDMALRIAEERKAMQERIDLLRKQFDLLGTAFLKLYELAPIPNAKPDNEPELFDGQEARQPEGKAVEITEDIIYEDGGSGRREPFGDVEVCVSVEPHDADVWVDGMMLNLDNDGLAELVCRDGKELYFHAERDGYEPFDGIYKVKDDGIAVSPHIELKPIEGYEYEDGNTDDVESEDGDKAFKPELDGEEEEEEEEEGRSGVDIAALRRRVRESDVYEELGIKEGIPLREQNI